MEAPYFVASTQTAWAALLTDRNQSGSAQQAQTLLEARVIVAIEGGYGYVERDAEACSSGLDRLPNGQGVSPNVHPPPEHRDSPVCADQPRSISDPSPCDLGQSPPECNPRFALTLYTAGLEIRTRLRG